MFDSAVIEVRAGKGGNGKVKFRREAHVTKGGPWGGDGGNGGSVYLVSDANLNTLQTFKYKQVFEAAPATDGGQKNMHGANGASVDIALPAGTEVWEKSDDGTERLLGDLSEPGMRLLIAEGGRGGWGNARFTSSINQEPLLAEGGDDGETRRLRLNLKVLADVGLAGLPNAGKSSTLTAISAARPKVADYPFTTLEPVLGVVFPKSGKGIQRFTVADIPGLIEGAHSGTGLGHEFLKHIERARVLVHVVDGSADDPLANIGTINNELAQFSPALAAKRQIIAINKLDLPGVKERRRALTASIRRKLGPDVSVLYVSAATHDGMDALVEQMWQLVQQTAQAEQAGATPADLPVLRPEPKKDRPNAVIEAPGVFRIVHPWAIRLAKGSNLNDWATRVQYHARLGHMKVSQELEQLGVRQGDKVLVAGWEFLWE